VPPRPHVTSAHAFLLALLLLVPAPGRAALALKASVEDLAVASEAVVRGTVVGRAPVRSGARIYTRVLVRVASAWRGSAPEVVEVVVPGGAMGGLSMSVSGAPAFRDGEEVVVFLSRAVDGSLRVTGLAQGKYEVQKVGAGKVAKPDLHDTRYVGGEIAKGERGAETMDVAELERRVRGAR
jgi:hypothetical protein